MKKIIGICDMCGIKSERLSYQSMATPYIHSFKTVPDYPSRFDGETVSFELCDDCLQLILESYIGISIGVDENE